MCCHRCFPDRGGPGYAHCLVRDFQTLGMYTFNRRFRPLFSECLAQNSYSITQLPLNLDDEKLGHCRPDKSPDKSPKPCPPVTQPLPHHNNPLYNPQVTGCPCGLLRTSTSPVASPPCASGSDCQAGRENALGHRDLV